MAASRKLQLISTKYFMCINWGHYVINLQNKKFVWLMPWPGRPYTNNAYATKPELRSHIRIHFVNHDCIGSLWQSQMTQKTGQMVLKGVNWVHNVKNVGITFLGKWSFISHLMLSSWKLREKWQKLWILIKIMDFGENHRFWWKPWILMKTADFDENSRFWWKPWILMKTAIFRQI